MRLEERGCNWGILRASPSPELREPSLGYRKNSYDPNIARTIIELSLSIDHRHDIVENPTSELVFIERCSVLRFYPLNFCSVLPSWPLVIARGKVLRSNNKVATPPSISPFSLWRVTYAADRLSGSLSGLPDHQMVKRPPDGGKDEKHFSRPSS